jgi:ectoine hydroxylase-related dioxygenase (phytanoyl-CoA dioxygenase family)
MTVGDADSTGRAGAGPARQARAITAAEIATFERDGVVLLRQALDPGWVELVARAIDRVRTEEAEHTLSRRTPEGDGETWNRYELWKSDADFRRFAFESPTARMAAALMRSRTATLTFDQVFVKEPGTVIPTVWHHDITVIPMRGRQHCAMWTSFERVPRALSIEFVRGSHLWGVPFEIDRPAYREANKDIVFLPVPDIANHRDSFDIIGWEVEPGDIVAFNLAVLHGAQGARDVRFRRRTISTRWAGDDVVYTGRAVKFHFSREWRGLEPGDRLVSPDTPQVWPDLDLHGAARAPA